MGRPGAMMMLEGQGERERLKDMQTEITQTDKTLNARARTDTQDRTCIQASLPPTLIICSQNVCFFFFILGLNARAFCHKHWRTYMAATSASLHVWDAAGEALTQLAGSIN